MSKPSLFEKRLAYKPFSFPWAYDGFVTSEQTHWLAREVPLNEDVKDWKTRLTDSERHLLTQIFRFFTQADCDVASGYIDKYLPTFKPVEIRMMMASIAAREGVHIQAYSMLIDEVGMPETEYAAFMDYAAMREKHEFMFDHAKTGDEMSDLARDIAVFSAFGEGMQLFASFVILLNFTRFGKCKGMGQIVAWSIRDESHHVECMLKVFHALLEEQPHIWTEEFKKSLYTTARDMVALEDRFIDLAFEQGGIEGLEPADVKRYIRYIADRRLLQLGLKANYGVDKNPMPWVDIIVNGKEHVNFFENRATDYSKGAVTGSWEDAFDDAFEDETADMHKDREFADREFIIWSKAPGQCEFCEKAKALLSERGFAYKVVEFTTPDDIELFKGLGYKTFPQVFEVDAIADFHVGGYDALHALLSA